MKVLFLIECLRAGGKERRLISLLKSLVLRHDVQFQIIVFDDIIHYDIPDIIKNKITLVKRSRKKDILAIYRVYKICRHFKPDIINPWGVMPAFYSIIPKYLLNRPLLNNQITDAPLNVRIGFHSLTLFVSDCIIANSEAGIRAFNVRAKSLVLYNGFDFSRLELLEDPDLVRKRYSISGSLIIGMVASFSKLKDYPTFLKVAEKILEKNPEVQFVCVGDGDKIEYINKVKINLRPKILFLDRTNNIESLINIFDIGVLSTFTEGISNSVMEYMSLSKPVVASGGGGLYELIEDGKSGFIVKQGDITGLQDRLERLINDKTLRIDMGIRGKKIIQKKFDYKKMCDEYYELYKQFSSSSRRS